MEQIIEAHGQGSSSGSSPLDSQASNFPVKPVAKGLTQPLKVVSNFYPLKCT